MKRLCSLILLLCLISSVYALQVFPQSVTIFNETADFSFYVSEDFVFNSTCAQWFTSQEIVTYAYDDAYSYSSCILYFSAVTGLETVAVSVQFETGVLQNHTTESITPFSLQTSNQSGVQLIVEEVERESVVGAFVGSIEFPQFRLSTLGAILFVLFFVSVVFLLIPKT